MGANSHEGQAVCLGPVTEGGRAPVEQMLMEARKTVRLAGARAEVEPLPGALRMRLLLSLALQLGPLVGLRGEGWRNVSIPQVLGSPKLWSSLGSCMVMGPSATGFSGTSRVTRSLLQLLSQNIERFGRTKSFERREIGELHEWVNEVI